MKGRPKTIATTGGGQGSSAESSSDWQHTQQLSDQVRIVMYKMIKGVIVQWKNNISHLHLIIPFYHV